MPKPILNIADVDLMPRPAAFAATGATYAIGQGDVIARPPGGPDTAHQIRNTGADELRYLAVSTRLSPEIAEYPDSGKFGVLAEIPAGSDGKPQGFRFVGRQELKVNYWDGEGKT